MPTDLRRAVNDQLDVLLRFADPAEVGAPLAAYVLKHFSGALSADQQADLEIFIGRELDFDKAAPGDAVAWIVERFEAFQRYGPGEAGLARVRLGGCVDQLREWHEKGTLRRGYPQPFVALAPLAWALPQERWLDFMGEASHVIADNYADEPLDAIVARVLSLRESMM